MNHKQEQVPPVGPSTCVSGCLYTTSSTAGSHVSHVNFLLPKASTHTARGVLADRPSRPYDHQAVHCRVWKRSEESSPIAQSWTRAADNPTLRRVPLTRKAYGGDRHMQTCQPIWSDLGRCLLLRDYGGGHGPTQSPASSTHKGLPSSTNLDANMISKDHSRS